MGSYLKSAVTQQNSALQVTTIKPGSSKMLIHRERVHRPGSGKTSRVMVSSRLQADVVF